MMAVQRWPFTAVIFLLSLTLMVWGKNKEESVPTKAPTLIPSMRPSFAPINPTGSPTKPPTRTPTYSPTPEPSPEPSPKPTNVNGESFTRFDVSINPFSLVIGPLSEKLLTNDREIAEQISESHLKELWDARLNNTRNLFNLVSIDKEDVLTRRILQTSMTSDRFFFKGTAVLFSTSPAFVNPALVNQYILFSAFENEEGDMYLESLSEVFNNEDITFVEAASVELTNNSPTIVPVEEEPSSSSFWDDYGLLIIIVCCSIVTLAFIFVAKKYWRPCGNDSSSKRNGRNSKKQLVDDSEGPKQFSRKRFFEKEPETDMELDANEFEHNLDELEDPTSFQFQDQDPTEQAHYYAFRHQYNENIDDNEMAKAAVKGSAIATFANSDDAPSPLKVTQRYHMQEENISPLGKSPDSYYGRTPKIQLQPSDEDTIELEIPSPDISPILHKKSLQTDPSYVSEAPHQSFRNSRKKSSNSPSDNPKGTITKPLTAQSSVNDDCLINPISQFICGTTDDNYDMPSKGSLQQIVVEAPSGKLGVYLDGTNVAKGQPCIVHGLKGSSVLQGKLQAGDILVSINDIDVQGMDAMSVSKLLSRSNKVNRRITILRPSSVSPEQKSDSNPEETYHSIVSNAKKSLNRERSFSGNSRELRDRKYKELEFKSIRSGRFETMNADYDSDVSDEIIVDDLD